MDCLRPRHRPFPRRLVPCGRPPWLPRPGRAGPRGARQAGVGGPGPRSRSLVASLSLTLALTLTLALAACGAGQRMEDMQRPPLSVQTTPAYDPDDLYRLCIVAFGAAPGVTYLGQLSQAADSGLSLQQIANILTTKPAVLQAYPDSLSHQAFAQQLVDNVVGTSASPEAKAEAVADIVTALSPPLNRTRGDIVYAMFSNLAQTPASDLKWAAMARKLAHQVVHARYFTQTMKIDTLDPVQLRAVVQTVTEDSSVMEAELGAHIDKALRAALGIKERWTVAFLPTDADLPNPDRGFYSFAGASDFVAGLDASALRAARAAGRRLLMARVQLDAWREDDLPPWLLAALDQRMNEVRQAGMKVTLLFNYDFSEAGQDATAERIRGHLRQLKPVLAAHAAVIPFMRAGFIGAWGEWHSSASGLSCEGAPGSPACAAARASRLIVRDALLDNVPQTTQIGIRYPADLMQWYPEPTQQARLGLHNDCFLAGPSDTGTYQQYGQREYVQALSARTAFGGETCVNGQTPVRDTCADILDEGRRYHLAWLNADYAPSVIAGWKAQGCLARVSAFMGYRLQLDGLAHAGEVAAGQSLDFDVDLRNVGWARLFTPRLLEVRLRHRDTGATWTAAAGDLRELPPQAGASSRVRVTLTVPAGAQPGDHEVWLGVPDVFPATEGDPRFAVRFANADNADAQQAWSAPLGRFRTGSTVYVR